MSSLLILLNASFAASKRGNTLDKSFSQLSFKKLASILYSLVILSSSSQMALYSKALF